jgi:hypothetical protein
MTTTPRCSSRTDDVNGRYIIPILSGFSSFRTNCFSNQLDHLFLKYLQCGSDYKYLWLGSWPLRLQTATTLSHSSSDLLIFNTSTRFIYRLCQSCIGRLQERSSSPPTSSHTPYLTPLNSLLSTRIRVQVHQASTITAVRTRACSGRLRVTVKIRTVTRSILVAVHTAATSS